MSVNAELLELLTSWDLADMAQHISNEGVDISHLKILNRSHLNDLLAPFCIGKRIIFESELEKWRLKSGKALPAQNDTYISNLQIITTQGPIEMIDQATQTDDTSNVRVERRNFGTQTWSNRKMVFKRPFNSLPSESVQPVTSIMPMITKATSQNSIASSDVVIRRVSTSNRLPTSSVQENYAHKNNTIKNSSGTGKARSSSSFSTSTSNVFAEPTAVLSSSRLLNGTSDSLSASLSPCGLQNKPRMLIHNQKRYAITTSSDDTNQKIARFTVPAPVVARNAQSEYAHPTRWSMDAMEQIKREVVSDDEM